MAKTINRVNNGSYLDNNIQLQHKDTYRNSVNGIVVSHSDGNFSWRNIKGNIVSFTVDTGDEVIGWGNIRDDLIVFANNETSGVGSIAKITVDENGIGTFIPVYANLDLNFSKTHPIFNETVGYHETPEIERIYWTDNFNQYRSFNVAGVVYKLSDVFDGGGVIAQSTYTQSITPNVRFRVILGSIIDDFVTYNKGDTFTNTDGFITRNQGSALIEDIGIGEIDQNPALCWGNIYANKIIGGGDLLFGSYVFVYQYFDEDSATRFSPLSRPIPMLRPTGPSARTSPAAENDYQNQQGDSITINSLNGLRITITDVDTKFDRIRVGVFYSNDYNVFEDGIIFTEQDVISETMTFEYLGGENLGAVSLDDVLIGDSIIKTVRSITEVKRYMVLAGIVEFGEFTSDITTNATIATETYGLPSDMIGHPNSSSETSSGQANALIGHISSDSIGTPSGSLFPEQWYKVINDSIIYNGTVQVVGSIFQVEDPVFVFTGSGSVIPVIAIKKYQKQDGSGDFVYDVIDINDDYLDYKGAAVAQNLVGYWGKETYRIAVVPYNKLGRPLFARFIDDITIPDRNHVSGNPMINRYNNNQYNVLQAMSLVINGLDITEIIDDICGIAIVRVERGEENRQILSEGALNQMIYYPQAFGAGSENLTWIPTAFGRDESSWEDSNVPFSEQRNAFRRPGNYVYYSPERMFAFENEAPQANDRLEILTYYKDPVNPFNGGVVETSNFHFWQKFYESTNPSDTTVPIGSTNDIRESFGITDFSGPNAPEDEFTDAGGKVIHNRTGFGYIPPFFFAKNTPSKNRRGKGNHKAILYTTAGEGIGGTYPHGYGDYYITPDSIRDTVPVSLNYVAYVRPKSNLYGGNSPEVLETMIYQSTGHFLEITDQVKADILRLDGKSILDGVQVFGGDCFVNIFDVNSIIKDIGQEEDEGQLQTSYSFSFPVQSKVNTALRQGNHIARNRSKEGNSFHPNGLKYNDQGNRLEDFNYNRGYSTDDVEDIFPALPLDFDFVTNFDYRVHNSERKINGEEVDSFMIFPTENVQDVEPNRGPLVNIMSKDGRVYYWQNNGLGYLPVDERELISNAVGSALQIGTGEAFARFDERQVQYGLQHQWALVETEKGFAWFDFTRKSLINMDTAFGITDKSIARGYYQFFNDQVLASLKNFDNPLEGNGIHLGYDNKDRRLYLTFRSPGLTNMTVGFDELTSRFTGRFAFMPNMYMFLNNNFYSIPDNSNSVYIHDKGPRGNFYGVVTDSFVEIVINGDQVTNKIIDNIRNKGNSNFFYKIEYENDFQTGIDNPIVDINGNILNRNYEFRNGEWEHNLPFDTNNNRFREDKYVLLRLYFDNNTTAFNGLIELVELQTEFREST